MRLLLTLAVLLLALLGPWPGHAQGLQPVPLGGDGEEFCKSC